MIRLTVVADGRRLGSVILDGNKVVVIATPKAAEQDMWDAIGAVFAAVHGGERAHAWGCGYATSVAGAGATDGVETGICSCGRCE